MRHSEGFDCGSTRLARATFVALLAGSVSVTALARQEEPASTAGTSPATPGQQPGAEDAPPVPDNGLDDLESLEPPDGKWQVAADGRKYFVTRLPKVEGTYRRRGKKKITYKRFFDWELESEDEDYFYVRMYKGPEPGEAERRREVRRQEQEEYLAEMVEKYKVEIRPADRLTFTSFDQGLPRVGQWRQGFELVDMNGDGHLDIVHGPARKGADVPVVFLGDGKGGWRIWRELVWPRAPYDYGDVAVADFDGDGRLDLGLGLHLRGLIALAQTTPGRFVQRSEGLLIEIPGRGGDASGFSSRAVEFADWNGDGRPDLIALGEGPRQMRAVGGDIEGLALSSSYGLVVFLNQGDGTWRPLSRGQLDGIYGDDLTLGDFDLDGRVDAATVSFEEGRKDILFLNSDAEPGWEQASLHSLLYPAWIFGVTSADFDRDGRPDLVTSFATRHGRVSRRGLLVSLNRSSGWDSRLIVAYEGRESFGTVASGDVDGDGLADVVASTYTGKIKVFLGDGAGGFFAEESPEIDPPAHCTAYGLEVADLDGDGRDDIVASFASEISELSKQLGGDVCSTSGALRAWRSGPKAAPAS